MEEKKTFVAELDQIVVEQEKPRILTAEYLKEVEERVEKHKTEVVEELISAIKSKITQDVKDKKYTIVDGKKEIKGEIKIRDTPTRYYGIWYRWVKGPRCRWPMYDIIFMILFPFVMIFLISEIDERVYIGEMKFDSNGKDVLKRLHKRLEDEGISSCVKVEGAGVVDFENNFRCKVDSAELARKDEQRTDVSILYSVSF